MGNYSSHVKPVKHSQAQPVRWLKGVGLCWPEVPHTCMGGLSIKLFSVLDTHSVIMEPLFNTDLQTTAECTVFCFLHSTSMDEPCLSQ